MKVRISMVVVACLGLAVCSLGMGRAQEAQSGGGDQDEMMQKWMAFMTPGAEHELLKYKAGKWNVKLEMWTEPGAESSSSSGTSEMKLIMGDRYLVDSTKTDYDGMPFEGMGITGYDNLKKKFVTVWLDNMSTGLMTGEGTYDKDKKTYTYTTMAPDVVAGVYKKSRSVERIVDDNQWVLEMYDTTPEGKEFLMMKGVYTRVK